YMGAWNSRTETPAFALIVQGILALFLVFALGSFVDAVLYTAAAVYLFYFATNLAVIVLRFKDPDVERPYRVTGYPVTTLLFMAVCAFLVYSAVIYKPRIALVGVVVLLLGVPIYWFSQRNTNRARITANHSGGDGPFPETD
ncbi:MAG: amino acid permease, partial [Planctomycetota bacterium]